MKTNRFRKSKKASARVSSRADALPRGMKPKDAFEGVHAPSTSGRAGDPRGLFTTILLVGVVGLAGLFHVWTRSEHLRLGYSIVAQESHVRAADGEKARLAVEVASLSSPIRIAHLANERLGLRQPDPGQVIDLPGTGHDGNRAIASSLASTAISLPH